MWFATIQLHKDDIFWKFVVWNDGSKLNIFGNDGRPYVRHSVNTQLDQNYAQKKTVKCGGSSVMVWGCFTASGVASLVRIDWKPAGEMYKDRHPAELFE